MSVEAVSWALTVPVGGNAKVVLLGLANHAHPDGTEAYPSYDTLAGYAHCDRSTAKRNAKKLEADGWIVNDGVGPHGEVKWRLNLGGQNAPGQNAPGGAAARRGGAPVPPEPSKEPSKKQQGSGAGASDDFPEDLPAELVDVALAAGKILKRTAAERGQKRPVTRATVGHAVLTYPDRDHVQVAREVEAWLLHGRGARRGCNDIVARYRNFLANADPMGGPPLPAGRRPNGKSSSGAAMLRDMASDLRQQGL